MTRDGEQTIEKTPTAGPRGPSDGVSLPSLLTRNGRVERDSSSRAPRE